LIDDNRQQDKPFLGDDGHESEEKHLLKICSAGLPSEIMEDMARIVIDSVCTQDLG